MIEERIKSAAETIHSANKLSITKGILRTVAAEALEEGIEEIWKQIEITSIRFEVFADHGYVPIDVAKHQVTQLKKTVGRLKEQG